MLAVALVVAGTGAVAVSVEDLFGVSFQKFGEDTSDRLVHVGAFPMITGVRLGVHHVGETGLVVGGLATASTANVTWEGDEPQRTTFVSIAPRAGYAWGRTSTLGGWVRGGPTARFAITDKTRTFIDVSVEVQLAWTFTPSVALLFGPSIEIGLAKVEKRHTSASFTSGIRVTL